MKYILGNWKLNKTKEEVKAYFSTFNNLLERSNLQDITIGIAPTYIEIPAAAENIKNILLLSQNVSAQNTGAYTGEVNCQMLKDYNVDGSLIGHSEVREHMNDLDESINKKVQNLLQNNLLPILCIGESLNDFDSGNTINVLKNQIEKDLINIDNNAKIIVAYEPIWAIGTGKTATSNIVRDVCSEIRNILDGLGFKNANIVYGGSVSDKNAKEILGTANVDGVLVGGASLDPNKFYNIIDAWIKK